ncbi:MAG: Ig-like domain-containing protein [Adlercreutzia sp.]|nr:Ig-like domain-containing protein [Adlercreutzia sp.]
MKNAGDKRVIWKSSNKKVASASKKGIVAAKKAGSATITAKIGSKKPTCKVKAYGSAKQKALASLNGWWHTWSSGGGYRYIKNGKIYIFSVGIDDDGMFYDSTAHLRKEKLNLVRVKHAPLGESAAYLVKVNGKTACCYNDNTHDELTSWDGTNYSGGGSLYRVNSSEVPSELKKYAKRF